MDDRATFVLGIAGSPRRGGNSERLLDACLAGVEERGASTGKLAVADFDIVPCTGCGACARTGACVIADDMPALLERLDTASAIVVASPVYFASVPAGLKAFYDRLQPYWSRRYVLGEAVTRYRPGAILLAAAGGDPYGHECAETTTRSAFASVGVRFTEKLVVVGPDARGDIEGYPDSCVEARAIGSSIADATEDP
ncbi:MAG: flavodoxin family protein [Clostridiales bacterium]|nr:flavodoxin family protein [Clostridiales bacterium]